MHVGIIGAGRIGGGLARQLADAGHQVLLSFRRDQADLDRLAGQIGARASTGSPADAVTFGEVVVISVPWSALPLALEQTGPLTGKIIIDTTNQFGVPPLPGEGQTAAAFNAARMPGARYTKSFNTLTSGFQAEAAGRTGDERAVQWLCGDDPGAKEVVTRLIEDAGFAPVDLGGTAGCAVMEAPAGPARSTARSTASRTRWPSSRPSVRAARSRPHRGTAFKPPPANHSCGTAGGSLGA